MKKNFLQKFLSETPRWVSFLQTVIIAIGAAGVVINPAIAPAIGAVATIATAALQTTEKK